YGRRRGRRLRSGQRDLAETLLPEIEIDPQAGLADFDPRALFGGAASEAWLEIGFGGGEHLAWQAGRNPGVGLIGCEPYMNGVAKLLGLIRERGLENVRVFRDDARLLVDSLPDRSLGRAFILFPDPWPKMRHHKRRIVADPVIAKLAAALVDGAELRIGTDDPGYLEWILWHMRRHPEFEWAARRPADWRDRPADWPETRYERKAVAAGRACAYLTYRRRSRPVA
ncbi:MAG: tRNA (guanine(46)-N(7))-methyltransferase TrmB, partial [Rhodospirillaceae bacterium]